MKTIFDELDSASRSDDGDFKKRREIVKAPMGWVGGKNRELDKILPHLPYRKGFVDCFGGSGCVLLGRQESPLEVYNDRHSGVCDFYRCLRDPALSNRLNEVIQDFLHSREEWYRCYDTWDKQSDIVMRSAMWYYTITYSFAKRGDAFGRSTYIVNATKALHFKKSLSFKTIHERLKGVIIENLDFRAMFKDYSHRDTVIYCDPPYLNTDHTKYFNNEFSDKDHMDLLRCIFDSDSFVALSAYDNPMYNKEKWDKKIEWDAYQSVRAVDKDESDDSDLRNKKTTTHGKECLYIKERKD